MEGAPESVPLPSGGAGPAVADSVSELLGRSLAVAIIVAVVAIGLVWLARRLSLGGAARGSRWMEVVARLPLEHRRSLFLVRVGDKTLLLGTSELGVALLREVAADELAEAPARPSFRQLVEQATLALRSRRAPAPSGPSSDSPEREASGAAPAACNTLATGSLEGAGR